MAIGTGVPTKTVKRVTTEFVEGEDAKPSARYSGDFWEVISGITTNEWADHLVRVYYANDRWESAGSPPENKLTSGFDEEFIREKWGGGRYILILYGPPGGSKRVGSTYRLELLGTPPKKFTTGGGQAATESNGSENVAIEAMRMYANPEFVRMQMQMMATAATQAMELIKSQIAPQQNPLETLRAAKEILGGGSHEGGLLDTIRVLKELGVIGSPEKKGIDEILSLITTLKTSGLINTGAPKADLASTFAANIPLFADRFVAGLEQLRLKSESDERIVRLQHGQIRPNDPNVITMDQGKTSADAASAQPTPAQQPRAAQAGVPVTPEVAQAIIAQAHLHRLVNGIRQPDSTGQDMYDYLVNAWPEILDELAKMSPKTLLDFFKSREMQQQYFQCEILAEVGDDPRLPKMIEDFLAIAKEAKAREAVEAAGKVAPKEVV